MNAPKNPLLVVGSVAIDHVITPSAERETSVGGSATYFAMAASYLTPVRLVGVVGGDFPETTVATLRKRGVDTEGLEVVSDGKTFRWKGRYFENMNQRETLETHLNVFETFAPKLPDAYRDSPYVFLANIHPSLQADVLGQMRTRPRFVGLDTMNLWIDQTPAELRAIVAKVDALTLNDEEAMQLTGEHNLVKAAEAIRGFGPRVVVIKRGEHGALLFADGEIFVAPAMPLPGVVDPTGAGDTFAGGFVGHLASHGGLDHEALRTATIFGSALASFCVEAFSYDRLADLGPNDLDARVDQFLRLTQFRR